MRLCMLTTRQLFAYFPREGLSRITHDATAQNGIDSEPLYFGGGTVPAGFSYQNPCKAAQPNKSRLFVPVL